MKCSDSTMVATGYDIWIDDEDFNFYACGVSYHEYDDCLIQKFALYRNCHERCRDMYDYDDIRYDNCDTGCTEKLEEGNLKCKEEFTGLEDCPITESETLCGDSFGYNRLESSLTETDKWQQYGCYYVCTYKPFVTDPFFPCIEGYYRDGSDDAQLVECERRSEGEVVNRCNLCVFENNPELSEFESYDDKVYVGVHDASQWIPHRDYKDSKPSCTDLGGEYKQFSDFWNANIDTLVWSGDIFNDDFVGKQVLCLYNEKENAFGWTVKGGSKENPDSPAREVGGILKPSDIEPI